MTKLASYTARERSKKAHRQRDWLQTRQSQRGITGNTTNQHVQTGQTRQIEYCRKIFQFYHMTYALCPTCACLRLFALQGFRYLTCIHCQYRHKSSLANGKLCDHCYQAHQRPFTVQCLNNQTIVLCDKCTASWMRDSQITNKLTTQSMHRAINEKWTANSARIATQ